MGQIVCLCVDERQCQCVCLPVCVFLTSIALLMCVYVRLRLLCPSRLETCVYSTVFQYTGLLYCSLPVLLSLYPCVTALLQLIPIFGLILLCDVLFFFPSLRYQIHFSFQLLQFLVHLPFPSPYLSPSQLYFHSRCTYSHPHCCLNYFTFPTTLLNVILSHVLVLYGPSPSETHMPTCHVYHQHNSQNAYRFTHTHTLTYTQGVLVLLLTSHSTHHNH